MKEIIITGNGTKMPDSVSIHCTYLMSYEASQVVLVVKNLPAKAGDTRDSGLIPGLGRSPGEGNGNPLQHSFLENFTDRGAWRSTVSGGQTRLKD